MHRNGGGMCSPVSHQGEEETEYPQIIVYHEVRRRIQDGECVCDTWRKKVLLQDVKLCPTWKGTR
jgi:hypothetical protein